MALLLVKTLEHLQLTFLTLFLSVLIGFPLGTYLAHARSQKWARVNLKLIATIQTIPALALIALAVTLLAFLRLPMTGKLPAILVLVLYGVLPVVTNTYTGLREVDSAQVEAGKAMGMTFWQLLLWVKVPLSLHVLMMGVRLSLVWTIGMVTLTSLVGAGGLGELILQGLRGMQMNLVLAGTLPAAALALLFDTLLEKTAFWLHKP